MARARRRALEPNVFYEPGLCARRGAGVRPRRRRGAGLVGHDAARNCSAFFRRASRRGATACGCRSWSAGRIPMRRSARRWSTATPPAPSIAAWLEHVARDPALPEPRAAAVLPQRGPFAAALDAMLDARRHAGAPISTAIAARCSRRRGDRADYLDRALGTQEAQGTAPAAAGGSPTRARCCSPRDRAPQPSRRRSAISSRSKPPAGRAAPAPPPRTHDDIRGFIETP